MRLRLASLLFCCMCDVIISLCALFAVCPYPRHVSGEHCSHPLSMGNILSVSSLYPLPLPECVRCCCKACCVCVCVCVCACVCVVCMCVCVCVCVCVHVCVCVCVCVHVCVLCACIRVGMISPLTNHFELIPAVESHWSFTQYC